MKESNEPMTLASVHITAHHQTSMRPLEWWEKVWRAIRFKAWANHMKVTYTTDPRLRKGDIIKIARP